MKKWRVEKTHVQKNGSGASLDRLTEIKETLLRIRAITDPKETEYFLHPPSPYDLTAFDVGIDPKEMKIGITRILQAHDTKESVVVYADYDADGVTSGAIMWEMLHSLGFNVMPYIPHRIEEGYGLSEKGYR